VARFSDADPDRTWDGLEVAADDPRGTTVVVRRPAGDSFEYLLLHRSSRGVDYEGDWAWTAPAGARQPGEAVYPAALREMAEEAGITGVELLPVALSGSWAVFVADATTRTLIDLVDPEHDRHEWVTAEEACHRVLPKDVAECSFNAATSRAAWRIGFRPMTYDDLPLMVDWRSRPHVSPRPGSGTATGSSARPRRR
jgi:8-oxo-dGTP pyrophosphatase MutT (NUDIX family)